MFSENFSKELRRSVGINGLISTIIGLLILFVPGRTAKIVTLLIGVSFVLIGISYFISVFGLKEDSQSKFGQILVGVVYMITGIVLLINLVTATAILFIIIGLLVGFTWLIEGFMSFAYVPYSSSKVWTVLSGAFSIIAGFILLFTPFWGMLALWTLLGAIMLILGVFKLARFFMWRF
ncbi:HdeD family acid-resistance protein [Lactococcus garvieae]|uniref:HdeD family acid-resistance protein n=1 Tax=Lactococcus garvieae TaxID=1363 RepID=UPI00254B3A69|nr:DUF308 domain-containing protein [Lactococcus garvieae]